MGSHKCCHCPNVRFNRSVRRSRSSQSSNIRTSSVGRHLSLSPSSWVSDESSNCNKGNCRFHWTAGQVIERFCGTTLLSARLAVVVVLGKCSSNVKVGLQYTRRLDHTVCGSDHGMDRRNTQGHHDRYLSRVRACASAIGTSDSFLQNRHGRDVDTTRSCHWRAVTWCEVSEAKRIGLTFRRLPS